jgi:adenylate cyclase
LYEHLADGSRQIWLRQPDNTTRYIYHVDPNTGVPVANSVPVASKLNYYPTKRSWYIEAVTAGQFTWTLPYTFSTGQIGLTAATPMYTDSTKTTVAGVIGVDFTLADLNNFLTTLKIAEHGHSFVVEKNGYLIASSQGTIAETSDSRVYATQSSGTLVKLAAIHLNATYGSFGNIITGGKTEVRIFAKLHGGSYWILVNPLYKAPQIDWLVVIVIPDKDLMGDIRKGNIASLTSTAGVILISVAVAIIVTMFITYPLSRLSSDMNNVAKMKLDSLNQSLSFLWEVRSIQLSFYRMTSALKSFSKYVPEGVIKQSMAENLVAHLSLEKTKISLFFLDIADFTAMCEDMELDQLMIVLGEAMEQLSTIVVEKNGLIDKYIGDCIMAIFGSDELTAETSDYDACSAALLCLKKLQDMHSSWKSRNFPQLQCRIGIHCGEALLGNFGSSRKLNFTALGDSVNLAARLEPLCKYYGTKCLISGDVYKNIRDKILCRAVDCVTVKGKTTGTLIYELIEFRDEATPVQIELEKITNDMLDALIAGNLAETMHYVDKALSIPEYADDKPLLLMQSRCKQFQDSSQEFNAFLKMDEKAF